MTLLQFLHSHQHHPQNILTNTSTRYVQSYISEPHDISTTTILSQMWSKFLRKIISQKYGFHSSNMKNKWQLFCQKNAEAELRGIQRISNTKPGEIVLSGNFRGTESLARNLWNENEKDKICPFSSLWCSSLWKALNYENQFGQAGSRWGWLD